MTEALPPVAILAGGLATRMRPLTEKVPKSMLEVAGEPFVAHQLRLLAGQGITRAVICAGFLAEQIMDFVGDGGKFGIEVRYVLDGPVLLGTGGAICKALPDLGAEFFVTYGDSYLLGDYAAVYRTFKQSGCPALMTVFRNQGAWDTSNAAFDGTRVRYIKRAPTPDMAYIDWGLGVFRATAFSAYPADTKFDLAEIQESLSAQGQLAGFEATHRFYEIGSMEGLSAADALLRAQNLRG